jgi:DNA-binding transcriptional MocR family regulator
MPLPDVQYTLRPGIVELRWGDPAPELLPTDRLAEAAHHAMARHGPDALNYGAEQGPGRLLEALAIWLGQAEGRTPPIERLLITGGVSHALDLICTLWTGPGDAVLVETPTYHLALRIFRDHRLHVVPLTTDADGLQPSALTEVVNRLSREGRAVRFVYTVPTFANPSGTTQPPDRRKAVVEAARSVGISVLEDDVYRRLWYDHPPPPPLADYDSSGLVIRLSSFSKILAPGMRVGWLEAAPETVTRLAGSGLLDSGGGFSHFAAHVVAGFLELGRLEPHIENLRTAYRTRRNVMLQALAGHMPVGCTWNAPAGGFFVWLQLPEGYDSVRLLPAAERGGVSFAPGARFCPAGGGERYLRLAFSLLQPEALAEGVARLADAVKGHLP